MAERSDYLYAQVRKNMLSHSAAGKNVCIESVDENDKI